jgi:MoxR-like ATPase
VVRLYFQSEIVVSSFRYTGASAHSTQKFIPQSPIFAVRGPLPETILLGIHQAFKDKIDFPQERETSVFASLEDLAERLEAARYIADPVMLNVIYVASKLGKPILAEGPPGSGKTELARVVAIAAGTHIERLQCFAGLGDEKAIGHFDEALQRVYLSSRYADRGFSEEEWGSIKSHLYQEDFFIAGPLLRALLSPKPCVLLIDEVDKVGEEFEAQLLEILEEWQVSIPRLGTVKAKSIPFVLITSNQQRRLGDPLRRRSLYMQFDHPSMEREQKIIRARTEGHSEDLRLEVAGFAQALRGYRLQKQPSIAEMLDLVNALDVLRLQAIDAKDRDTLLPLIAKTEKDRERLLLRDGFAWLVCDIQGHIERLKADRLSRASTHA